MVNDLLQDIFGYIAYLHSLSLKLSFIDKHYHFLRHLPDLFAYNLHNNSYCNLIKSSPKALKKCECRQFLVEDACKNGEFLGVCWAGVHEFVFPVLFEQSPIAFISVSGYCRVTEKIFRHLTKIAEHYGFDKTELSEKYAGLNQSLPDLDSIRRLIQPLCRMLELLYLQFRNKSRESEPDSVYKKIFDYLYEHLSEDISLSDIANACHYSQSYIRHIFKKETNYTISRYLNILRITKAKQLLLTTNLPISEIALIVGYNDPNYFTNTFRKITDFSPKAWRSKNLTSDNTDFKIV